MSGRYTLLLAFLLALLLLLLETGAQAQTELPAHKIDLAGCVRFDYQKTSHVFNDLESLRAMRYTHKDARDCLKMYRGLDFGKYTVLGVQIRNAQCQAFPLEHQLTLDEDSRKYLLRVTTPPLGPPCRGLTIHELWLLVPKLAKGYDAVFEITENEKKDESPYKCRPGIAGIGD